MRELGVAAEESVEESETASESEEAEKQLQKEECNGGALAHLSVFAGWFIPLGNFAGPLAVLFLKGNESEFIDHHAREAFNFQVTIILSLMGWALFAGILEDVMGSTQPMLYFGGLAFIGATGFVLMLIAPVRAIKGAWYRFPIALRLL